MTRYTETPEQRQRRLNDFTYHAPIDDQIVRYGTIRDAGLHLAGMLNVMCPASRELSLAMTKLEEAIMWANAAIARNEPARPDEPGS